MLSRLRSVDRFSAAGAARSTKDARYCKTLIGLNNDRKIWKIRENRLVTTYRTVSKMGTSFSL